MFHQRVINNQRRTLIINSDDYGIAPTIDKAIIELLISKRITSISAIVNQSNSQNAAHSILQLKQTHPQIYQSTSIGLHLNFTRGAPLSEIMRANKCAKDGKFDKQQALLFVQQEGPTEAIADEFREQVQQFIRIYKRRPSHVDGHNHIHIFPRVAKVISGILSEFGIYKIRLPTQGQLHNFGQFLLKNIKNVRQMYESNSIIWPDVFLGTKDSGNLKAQSIKQVFESNSQKKEVELMCHPGYPTQQGSGWTSKQDRLKQKKQLESQQFKQLASLVGGLSSYLDLQTPSAKNNLKLLIYSKLQIGTGNYTTSLRLKEIFQKIGYEVYTWSVQSEIQPQIEVEDLQKFLISFGITLVLGINVSRSAKIIHEATYSSTKIRIQVPYILVIAGTDANYTFQSYEKCQELSQSLRWCQCIVSISKDMTNITQKTLKSLNIQKRIHTIVQSSSLGCSYDVRSDNNQTKESINSFPNKKYILFSTSFRRIKCVQHVFKQLNKLIQKYNLQVIVLGPIIQRDYYQKIKDYLGNIRYLGTLNQAEYSKSLKSALAVINCSQTEGMSCSILEALEFGVPIVARSNAGNKQLITHGFNGLIYESPQEFTQNFERLLEDSALRERLTQNGKKVFNQKYSFQVESMQYRCMIEKQIKNKTMEMTLNNQKIRIFNEPHVHNTSEVNNQLYLQITPKIQNEATILDLGCGTSVFSLIYLIKAKMTKIKLYLVDISEKILGNALFNCRQSSFWDKLEIIAIKDCDFINKADKNIEYDVILFNPPQTPFRNPQNRLDKNGGINGIKFYQTMFKYFAESKNQNLYLLYSYLAWPSKVKELLDLYKLKCTWKSKVGVHKIMKDDYDKMEANLSDYIFQHWKDGKADIYLIENEYSVPAEVQLINKA